MGTAAAETYTKDIRFSIAELQLIDSVRSRFGYNTREEALRKMLCTFGERFGVAVTNTIPQVQRDTTHKPLSYTQKKTIRRTVFVSLPDLFDSNNWLALLKQSTGDASLFQLIRRAVREYPMPQELQRASSF